MTIQFKLGELSPAEQQVITTGFDKHTASHSAPRFEKQRLNWLAYDGDDVVVGALTADLLWDWVYIDELWVDDSVRGQGRGRELIQKVEQYAASSGCTGIWLWTQSWQAAEFYRGIGYEEFTRFLDFPKGHSRMGFRKTI